MKTSTGIESAIIQEPMITETADSCSTHILHNICTSGIHRKIERTIRLKKLKTHNLLQHHRSFTLVKPRWDIRCAF